MSDIQAQMYEVQSDYLVETGISLPSLRKATNARGKAIRAVSTMSIGDSFFAPQKDIVHVRSLVYSAAKLLGYGKFKTRKAHCSERGAGIRVWRVN
jgi:hypothetical protein